MKLDKIRFAQLINRLCLDLGHIDATTIREIDDIIEFDEPAPVEVPTNKVSEGAVNDLLAAFAAGDRKIEAIKAYRVLTGAGLKESKDAIEKYSPPKSNQYTAKDYQFKLLDSVYKANAGDSGDPFAEAHVLDGFSDQQLRRVYDYISSFDYHK